MSRPRSRASWTRREFAGLLAAAGLGAAVRADEPAGTAERRREMDALVRSFRLTRPGASPAKPMAPRDQPLHRWNDRARITLDGGLWAWGETGRPPALVSAELIERGNAVTLWACEFVSLADPPLQGGGGDGHRRMDADTGTFVAEGLDPWVLGRAGLTMIPIPAAPAPAETEPQRLRQMKELVRRVSAFETIKDQKYELRLLPTPIHRYADAPAGLTDGALFLLTYGTNPEVVVVLEARGDSKSSQAWQVGFARLTTAAPSALLDGREVWNAPETNGSDPTGTYFIRVFDRQPAR